MVASSPGNTPPAVAIDEAAGPSTSTRPTRAAPGALVNVELTISTDPGPTYSGVIAVGFDPSSGTTASWGDPFD